MATVFSTTGTNNIPLHAESQSYLEKVTTDYASKGGASSTPPTLEQTRQDFEDLVVKNIGEYDYAGNIKDINIPSQHLSDGIPARIYQPSAITSHPLIMVFYHSGGLLYGSIKTADHLCRIMSGRYGCIVVSVGYRRAPEAKLPEIIKDCDEAAKWVLDNREELGGASDSLVGVAGSSAGGLLSACVCHNVPGLSFQVLVYPMIDPRCDHPSVEEFASTLSLPKDGLLMLYGLALENEAQKADPRVNPLVRSRHDNLPPALVIVAECDVLRDEGIRYSETLRDSGSHSELMIVRGAVHIFFDFTAHFKELSGKAFNAIEDFLQRVKNGKLEEGQ